MKYTLDRFKRSKSKDKVPDDAAEGVVAATQLSTWSGRLGRLLDKLSKKKDAQDEAKASIVHLMGMAVKTAEEDEDSGIMSKLLSRVLKFIGKRVFKAIVQPILRFAARMAMNIVRIAARTLLRFVILPAIELVATALTALVATPIGLGILAVAALGAGGYMAWKKWGGGAAPEIVEVEETAPTGAVVDGQAAPEVAPTPEPPKTRFEQAVETVRQSAPVQAIERVVERPKVFVPKKGSKFQGFGDEMDSYIHETAVKYPILPEPELRGFIKMEAGWTGNMSPTGAIGTGQFTAGTWNSLISKGGAQLGMTRITGIYGEEKDEKGRPIKPHIKPNPNGNFRTEQDPRFNRRINTLATGLLASGNAEMLRRAGIPITGANLYMMHNIGPGIIDVMKGRSASASTIDAMRKNGMTGAINTPEKFLQFQKGRYETAYQEANTTTEPIQDVPQMAQGKTLEQQPAKTTAAKTSNKPVVAATPSKPQTDLVRGPNNSLVRL
jgi:hypothetical protein